MNIHLIGSIDGEIRKVNKGWEKTLGYTKEESVGKNIFDFVHPEDKEFTLNELSELKSGKTTFYFENRYKHKNGTYVTLAWSAIFNTSGKMLHGVAKDITQQKAYHEALLKSEENYRALSENASHIIITHDFNGKINYANKYALDFIGITKEQAIGTDIKQFIYKPRDVNDLNERIIDFEAGNSNVHNYEVSIELPSGEKRMLEVLGSPIKLDHKLDSVLLTAYDITYRKEAELKIKEQNEEYEALNEELRQTNDELFTSIRREEEINERFNLAIEASNEGIFDWNLISNEIYYSPRWKSMLGYEENELPNDFSVLEKLTDSEDVKKSWNMLNQLINRDIDKFDMEFKMQHKKGHWVYIHSRAKVFFNNEEKAIRVVGTHTDITERKLAEKIIQESEEMLKLSDSRYRKAEEIGKVGNWEYNIQTEIFWASDESKRIYGYEINKEIFTTEDVESCIPERERVHQALVDLIEHDKPYNLEFDIITNNTGERKTITSIAELIKDKNGGPIKIVGVIQDITVRKEAETKLKENEEKLRLSIDNSPLGICTNDMNGKFISTNAAYEKLVGYTKEELKQLSFFDITHPDYLPKNRELFNAMANNQQPGFYIEKKYIRKDGTTVDVRIHTATIFDNNKQPLFGMAFTEDITSQKIAEEDLIVAKEKAEESNRLKTEFLHNMSHEIRTPMNGIMGFSALLCELDGCTDEQKNYTGIIQNSSTQLLRIIDDILDISTLETKQVKVQNSEFDVNQFIMELFSIYDLKSKERNLPLYLRKELKNKSSLIISDKAKIHKILTNLLDNAFKFTSSGKIEFGYKIEHSNIVFFVKDTGVGISKDKQTKIFERFSQESSLTAQTFGGLGLGLSIAKENAELLGGKLSVKSEKNKGSSFFVEIPYNPLKIPNNNITANTGTEEEISDVITILIAEDEVVNYLYLEAILENTDDFKVKLHHVTNGEEAVSKCLNDDSIDLVLMDIKMPVMNGYVATEKIKAIKPELPIIAQTAYSTASEKDMALKYGCNDFISKPIMKKEILLLISKHMKPT
jgi:PAS domain S-box-containing protein